MTEEAKIPSLTWTQVLAAIRAIAPAVDGSFLIDDLVKKINHEHDTTYEYAKAAKWVAKFADWGYVRRGDFLPPEPGVRKPKRTYHITKYGHKVNLEGGQDHLLRLLDAIQGYRDFYHIGDPDAEVTAATLMFEIADEVTRLREERFKKREENAP